MKLCITGSLLLVPALLLGQQAQGHEGHAAAAKLEGGGVFPPGWSARPDEGGKPAEVKVEDMGRGWHVTTAASTIVYREQDKASGKYTFSAKLHLFPEAAGHREAYGVFVGGQDLQGAGQRYTYFLLRGDGTYKVKRRAGASATDVTKDWIPNSAIVKGKPDGSVVNLVNVVVGQDSVSFQVNGQQVYAAPAASVDVNGTAGLRVNHNLSVHVETLEIKK